MEKIVYLALGSDLVSVKLHPTIQTVGQAKAFIFDHGLAPKKCQWIYKEKIMHDTEQLALPPHATVSCIQSHSNISKRIIYIKDILPPQLLKISETYSRQLITTFRDLKESCKKRRANFPAYCLEQSYKCQYIQLRYHGPGRNAYIDIPLANNSKHCLDLDIQKINEFVQVARSSDDSLVMGSYSVITNSHVSKGATIMVRWHSHQPLHPGCYKVKFTNGNAASQLHQNDWLIGYSGEYSILDAFLLRNTLTLDFNLTLKSRLQQIWCNNEGTARPVALCFEGDENRDQWHVLVRNIAATWDVSMDHVVSISTNDVKIEDKYAAMQLNPTDLVTFHIVEPVVLQIPFAEVKIITIIGEGNFGVIYAAEWNDQKVAVKKFKAYLGSDHVIVEAKALVRLQHKHIVSLTGVTTDPITHETMIVMEYMENGSLEDLLNREKVPISREDVVQISLDVANGLIYLHQRNIIHRDLKSANVLLYANKKRAKLSDFGTARFLTKSSKANTVIGTIGFMAPEMLQNMPYNEQADVYSFGALIFQMITTRSLPIIFAELDREAKIKSVVNDIELQEFIIACCKTDPTQRPTTRQCVDTLKRIRRSGHNCTTVKISYKLRNALNVINKIFS
jgi:tRNA A-37 threonylcarbamoyl transferase component Bud32